MSAEPTLPAPVLAWLEQVDARWRAAGLDVALRSRMGADLVEDLVGGDAHEFADELAAAYGRSVTPSRRPRPSARTRPSPRPRPLISV